MLFMIFALVLMMDIDLWFSTLGMFLCDFGVRIILENKGILEVFSLSLFSESLQRIGIIILSQVLMV